MATVNTLFVSTSVPSQGAPATAPSTGGSGNAVVGSLNCQDTSYSSDLFEFRLNTGESYQITKRDALNALEQFKFWVTDPNGLDALIQAEITASNTCAGVP